MEDCVLLDDQLKWLCGFFIRIYDLKRLLKKTPATGNGSPAYDLARIDEIRRLIIDDVETLSWKENGGDDGSISTEAFGTNLIIVQTAQAHMQIEALLRTLDSRIFESGKDR